MPGVVPSPAIDRRGLILGAGTCLAGLGRDGGLALAADRERVLTLLSVAAGRPVSADVLAPLAVASEHWRRVDRALANLQLVFAGLPRLATGGDLNNVRDAADLLDGDLPPRALMKALGFDTTALDKFDPNQPRVPAGSGRTSGQWTDGAGGADGLVDGRSAGRDEAQAWPEPSRSTLGASIIPVANDGPLRPLGEVVIPHDGFVDPLDPKNLNEPLSAAEVVEITEYLNMIRAGGPANARRINPHPYENLPHSETGAQLPIDGTYKTYYKRPAGPKAGSMRITIDDLDPVYFTKN